MRQKTAIITGSSRGIGYAIARQLGRDGYQVVMVGTGDQQKYQESLDALSQEHISYLYVQADIASSDDRKKIVDAAVQTFGGIDVLVNNAGVAPLQRNDILQMTEESFDRVIGINTKAPLFLTQLVANIMLQQTPSGPKRGVIVNIASCSSVVSSPSRAEYCISKAAMSMETTLFAHRLAADGIMVHEVRPGIILTDMTSTVKAKYDAMLEQGVFPMNRWGTPQDVASVVSLLCDERMCYSTGNHIDVDGGFHIPRL